MNGVSTLDLVLIQRHILDLSQFNDPYKAIAADINNDGKIRSSDLVELRKLILGVNDKFLNNTSWRFIDNTQSFSDVNNPWPFNEVMNIQGLTNEKDDINFYGQKIGDVNQSAESNIRSTDSESRSNKTLAIWTDNKSLNANQTAIIDFISPKAVNLYGFQFTVSLDQLEFIDFENGLFTIEDSNYKINEDGTVSVSVSSSDLVSVETGDALFSINVNSNVDGLVAEMISFNSSQLAAESYFDDLVSSKVELSFVRSNLTNESGFAVKQNEPNPFSEKTHIQFSIPQAGDVGIHVFDFSGKVVISNIQHYSKGNHVYEIDKDLLPLNGVYYCKIENNNNSSIIKMIHLK
jgi:hypothetical protein